MKAVLYARVSSERQEQEKTVESQVAELENYAKENNHIIIDKYIDNGFSGSLLARPELDRLRDDASKKLFDAVLIHSPDRLARRYVYQEIVMEELKNKGIEAVFLNRSIAHTPEDQLLLGMQGLIAEYERAKITERTRRGRLHKAKEGYIFGGRLPYGYFRVNKAVSETGFPYYVINEEEAKTVRLIFELVGEKHMATNGVVHELYKRGIKPRGGKDLWCRSIVAQILRNDIYTGKTYYNKRICVEPKAPNSFHNPNKYRRRKNTSVKWRPKDQWIPIDKGIPVIIPKELFDKAQRQLDINYQFSRRNTKLQYLLGKGLLRCALDGKTYVSCPMHGTPFYKCHGKSRLVSVNPCKSRAIIASIIEPLVWYTIVETMTNTKLILSALQKRKNKMLMNTKLSESTIEEIEKSLDRLKQSESRLLEAYSKEVISIDQLKEQNINLQAKRKQLEKEKENLTNSLSGKEINYTKEDVINYVNKFKRAIIEINFEKKLNIVRAVLREAIVNTNNRILLAKVAVPLNQNEILCPQSLAKREQRLPNRKGRKRYVFIYCLE